MTTEERRRGRPHSSRAALLSIPVSRYSTKAQTSGGFGVADLARIS